MSACRPHPGRPVVARDAISRPRRLLALLDSPRRVGDLAAAIDLDTSRTSDALQALRASGQVYQPARGLWVRTP